MNLASTLRAAVAAALVLSACADTTADPVAETDPTVPATAAPTTLPPTTITTLAPTTTTTLAPTTTTTLAPPTTLPPTTTTTPAPTTTVAPTTSTSTTTAVAGPPPETPPTHGGFSWAVYLGYWESAPDPAELDEAVAPARAVGYDVAGWSSAGCDQGAAEALGFDPNSDHAVAALYFATEADARAAAALIGEGVDAVAEVQTYCLD